MKLSAKSAGIFGLLALAVFLVGRVFLQTSDRGVRNKALVRREIALRVLGEALAAEFAGKEAIIVSNPFTKRPGQPDEVYAFEEAGVRGLKKGWGDKIRLRGVVFPELNPSALGHSGSVRVRRSTTTPLSYLTADDAWDSLWRQNTGVELVVSLIGLPANIRQTEIWNQPKPRFALLFPDLSMIGSSSDVAGAFRSGKIAAVVLEKPRAPSESSPIARDIRTEFDERFVLMTPRNLEALVKAQ